MNQRYRGLNTLAFIMLISFTATVFAAKTVHNLSHQNQAPILDGVIDEPQWQTATVIEVNFDDSPGKGKPAQVKTTAYIYEDGTSLHVAIYAYDPDPSSLSAHLVDRDKAWNDDLVGLTIDTFNDERSAYEFYVNPLGVQVDARMKDNNGWQGNDAWDAIWESAATIVEDGWTAEISIPFKALRFPKVNGEQEWGIAIYRAYQDDLEYWLSDFKRDNSVECNLCQFAKARGFNSVKPGNNFQLTPTLTYSESEIREAVPGPWLEGENNPEAGLDIRWGVTENSVINATINPDFSQVEADAAQLDVNNTDALFIEEKRPFFLDGADYFSSDTFNLVHTRNIADPDYGTKVTGKKGNHSYGLMLANDNSTTFVLPGNQGSSIAALEDTVAASDIAIARYKLDVGKRSSIGLLLTSRQGEDYLNNLASIDGKLWLGKNDSLDYQFATSRSENPLAIQEEFELAPAQDDTAMSLEYIRDTTDYKIKAEYAEVGSEFRADMGFVTDADYKLAGLKGTLKFYGSEEDWVKNINYTASWENVQDQDGNELKEEIELSAAFDGIFHSHLELELDSENRFFGNEFDPQGETYEKLQGEISLNFRPNDNLKLEFSTSFGDQIDYVNAQPGSALKIGMGIDLNLGKHVKINLSQNYSSLDVEETAYNFDTGTVNFDGGNLFTANLSDLRLNYQFSIQSQLRFSLQYTDIEHNANLYRANFDLNPDNDISAREKYFSTQLVYSYKLNAQSLFYLGYAGSGFQDDSLSRIERDFRTFFVKISYAWQS